MRQYKRMSTNSYKSCSSHKMESLFIPYDRMVKILGDPHKRNEMDFPDDKSCVDVCWGLESLDNPKNVVLIWGYAGGDSFDMSQRLLFPAYYTDRRFFDEIVLELLLS